jgi:speckle-type POZ protein
MYINAEITDRRLKNNEDFVWAIEVPLTGKFTIDVEFIDLKITSPDVSIYLLF